MSGPERAHEQEPESIPLVAPDVGFSPAGVEGFASAHVLAMQRSAGNARVAGWLARVPAPPAGRTRDRSQVAITGSTAAIDYLAYVENNFNLRTWDYSSTPWNVSRTWRLFDAADRQVEESSGAISGAYTLFANVLRDHVHRHGTGSLGTWTLRLEKDSYYDDVSVAVTQDANRPGPPLAGETTQSFYNIRELPADTARVLGTLEGASVPVTIDHKQRFGGRTWYRIRLGAQVGTLTAGTVGWVVSDAVVATTPWGVFQQQLHAWESANMGLSLADRITRLRQMCHSSDLPFDAVIGVPAGPRGTYADQRPFQRGQWELLRDSQQVLMPDGQIVDVYHLLVGLDVLPRRDENRTISQYGMRLNVGQNYSAATWSGDIGAAAADAFLRQDAEWERRNPTADVAARQTRYWTTRVSEADLYGDVDAWGIDQMRTNDASLNTIEALLGAYYGAPQAPAQGGAAGAHTSRRRSAVERFLSHYGFVTQGPQLRAQASARAGMAHQIGLFAEVWIRNRAPITGSSSPAMYSDFVEPLTDRFLDWLQRMVSETGATISGSGIPGAIDVEIQ
jgi:hypothetical protein